MTKLDRRVIDFSFYQKKKDMSTIGFLYLNLQTMKSDFCQIFVNSKLPNWTKPA